MNDRRHFKVRPGFYVHRNGSVLTPGTIIELPYWEARNILHQVEEVEIKEAAPTPTPARTRKPKSTEGVES